jgi:DNA-binding transcriptional MerR regulator
VDKEPSEEMQIGRFGELVGLSVPQLRRYDRMQLLAPAGRSPESGYRYYTRQQTGAARVIALLRSMDMPLAEIRRVLSGLARPELERLFRDHRSRLEARLTEVHKLLEVVDEVVLEGAVVTPSDVKLSGLAALMPYLQVRDVQKSAAYYQEALGFRLAWRTAEWQLAAVDSGEVEIFLVPWSGESAPTVQTCYVYADDPDALCSEFAEAGADIEDPVVQHYALNMDFAMTRIVEPHATDAAWLIGDDFQLDEIARRISELAVDPMCLRIR